ncbi:diaminopimelate epimerase [candidate division KSB1 bacterium]
MKSPRSYNFWKLEAAGNDFIFIDNRDKMFSGKENKLFRRICTRRRSVGADGVILIEDSDKADYRIRYFNADGFESTMCGNAGRSALFFAYYQGIAGMMQKVEVIDGIHSGAIFTDRIEFEILAKGSPVKVEIDNIDNNKSHSGYKIDTGVPHVVLFVDDLDFEVVETGRKIRYHKLFAPEGTNANFIEIRKDGKIYVRVYERGVEDETLSCGTGATACAIVLNQIKNMSFPVSLNFPGGELTIDMREERFYLAGDVNLVYKGKMILTS